MHAAEKNYQCDICENNFSHKCSLNWRMQETHMEKVAPALKCQFCPKTFARKQNYKLHIAVHEKKKNFRCVFQ